MEGKLKEFLNENKNILFSSQTYKLIEKFNLVRNEDVSSIPGTLKAVAEGMIKDLSTVHIPDTISAVEYIQEGNLDLLGNTLERLKRNNITK